MAKEAELFNHRIGVVSMFLDCSKDVLGRLRNMTERCATLKVERSDVGWSGKEGRVDVWDGNTLFCSAVGQVTSC